MKSAYISDLSKAIAAYFAKLSVIEEGVVIYDEEKEDREKRVIALFEKEHGTEQGKKRADECIAQINELLVNIDELLPNWRVKASYSETENVFSKLFQLYPNLSSKAVECLTLYVLGNACKDHGHHEALKYQKELLEYCEVFKSFFKIEKNIFKGVYGDIAFVPIPSFQLIKKQFDKMGIHFISESDSRTEYLNIKREVEKFKRNKENSKRRITSSYSTELRSYISWVNDAQELDEIMLTYTSQHSRKRLRLLVNILYQLTQMKQCNVIKNYNETGLIGRLIYFDAFGKKRPKFKYPAKRDTTEDSKEANFIRHIVNVDTKGECRLEFTDESELFCALEEISAIAQNMLNCVFPGIYTDCDIEKLRFLLEGEVKDSEKCKINSKYETILPDKTIPFYSLIQET